MATSRSKGSLSELIEDAHTKGPQIITHHRAERSVDLSIDDFRALIAHKPNLFEYLLGRPNVDGFKIEYSRDTGRRVEL